MTNLDLTRLRELAEKATPRPLSAICVAEFVENKWPCRSAAELEFIAKTPPQTILALIDKIQSLQSTLAACRDKCGQLEKEADWLADKCRSFCDSNHYCNDCALYPAVCPIEKDITFRFKKYAVFNWRRAARKAVEAGDE